MTRNLFVLIIAVVALLTLGYSFVFLRTNEKLKDSRKEKVSLENTLESKEAEIENLKDDLKEKKESLTKLKGDLKKLNKDLDEFKEVKDALANAKKTIRGIDREKTALGEKKEALEKRKVYLEERIKKDDEEVKHLSEELAAAKGKLAFLSSELESPEAVSRSEIVDLQNILLNKEKSLISLKAERDRFKKEYAEMLKERGRLNEEIKNLQRYHSFSYNSQVIWERKLEKLSDQLKQAREEKGRLEGELRKAVKVKEAAEGELARAKKDKEELNRLNANLLKKLGLLSPQVNLKKRRIKKLEKEIRQKTKAFIEEIRFLETEAHKRKIKLDKLTTAYNRLKGQLKETAKTISKWERESRDKNSEITSLRNEISFLKLRLAEKDKLNTALQERLAQGSTPSERERRLEKKGEEGKGRILIDKTKGEAVVSSPGQESSRGRAEELKKKIETILQP